MANSTAFEHWDDVVEHAKRLGPDCFMATVRPDGDPHVAIVSPGFVDGLMVVATWESSVKAENLRAGSSTMFHWAVREATGNDALTVRGTTRLVEAPTERHRLWELDPLPYELGDWYSGPDDPELLWVEVIPARASLNRSLGAGGTSSWGRRGR